MSLARKNLINNGHYISDACSEVPGSILYLEMVFMERHFVNGAAECRCSCGMEQTY